ncbi:Site-specific recombinase XerD [Ekhidna lutea]|uniref:Site-specific recombinase XerD n=1 Tax=Ekhidna lutea TaxID=447679 RepID=A0A239F863_EKHLU|nr:site-specific integrase [Ekhidna lutea]SNS52987.1 Site-specific recombinase XerD [Ekhidna lutea]
MGVKLRLKEYKSGTKTFYLDIYHNNQRTFEFLEIRIDKNATSNDRKEKKELAERVRAKRELELENYVHGTIPKHRKKANFNDYYQEFLNSYTKKDKRMFRYAYEKFLDYSGHKSIAAYQIDFQLIEGYRDYLKEKAGLTGETPYDYFARFKRVLKKAFKDGLIDQNRYLAISELSIKRIGNQLKKQVLSIDEIRSLNNTECGNEEVKRAFLFSCFSGLGEAEIRKLTWSRILKEDKIMIFREKSKEQIINDIPKSAIQFLGDRGKNEDLIFKLPSNVAVSKNLKNWTKKAGITKNISFYCARHTFATQLLLSGADVLTVSNCMGHSSTKHTTMYLNYVDGLKTKAIADLPSL